MVNALSYLAAASIAVVMCAHAVQYTVIATLYNDEMSYRTDTYTWGLPACNGVGRTFAPPRNSHQLFSFQDAFPSGTITDGWVGLEWRPTVGESPHYFVVDGRYKDCLYDGYPFGQTSSYWEGAVALQAVGQVKWVDSKLSSIATTGDKDGSHCVLYTCNNQDDCFGNGLSVSGTWPSCSCGGCAPGVKGDSCNNITISGITYVLNNTLVYGTPDSMRALCESAGLTMFSGTPNKADWDALHALIPPSFTFYVDINDTETRFSWKNSKGDLLSQGSIVTNTTTTPANYIQWAENEGEDASGGRCVQMDGGEIYQGDCLGNRYHMCVAPAKTATHTAPSTVTKSVTASRPFRNSITSTMSSVNTSSTSNTTTPMTSNVTDNTTTLPDENTTSTTSTNTTNTTTIRVNGVAGAVSVVWSVVVSIAMMLLCTVLSI